MQFVIKYRFRYHIVNLDEFCILTLWRAGILVFHKVGQKWHIMLNLNAF